MQPKSKVNGILLKRQVFGEYNEKLTFFTDILGKIIFFSYGSKSPRSKRRALLAYPALFTVVFEKKGNLFKLLELERIISLWNDGNDAKSTNNTPKNQQNSFMKLWPHIDRHIPLNSIDEELFSLLKHFFQPKVIVMPNDFLDLLMLANLLRHLGLIGLDFYCEKCKKLCHQNLIVTKDNSLWGEECYLKHYQEINKTDLYQNLRTAGRLGTAWDLRAVENSQNPPKPQSPNTSENLGTSENLKNPQALEKSQLLEKNLTLSVRSIALIKTLVKHPANETNISTLLDMYLKNFAKKEGGKVESEKDWKNAYRYLDRISKES